jgi:hypothetical protein
MDILPAEYGIAGFMSVTRRSLPDDDRNDFECLILGASNRLAVKNRALMSQLAQKEEMADSLAAANSRLREQTSEQAEILISMSAGDVPALRAAHDACGRDIASLRRENAALRTSLEWHVAELLKRAG